jgi:uncharacterized membrane protein YobD (UPF0266 family)
LVRLVSMSQIVLRTVIFSRFCLPLLHDVYYAEAPPRGTLRIAALALVFVAIAWICWNAKERCDDKRKIIRGES